MSVRFTASWLRAALGFALLGTTGCLELPDLIAAGSGPAADQAADSEAATTTGDSAAFATDLTSEELDLLQQALASLAGGASGTDPLSAWSSVRQLRKLGLHNRELAVLALDAAAAGQNLTTEQNFTYRLVRAYLSHDAEGMQQLALEQLAQTMLGDAIAGAAE